jgi:hypothetical protein
MTSPTAQGSTNVIAISVIYFGHGLVSGCHKKWWHVVSSYLFFGRVSRTSEKSIKRSGSWYSESWFKQKSTGKPYNHIHIYIYIQDDVDNERCVLQVQKPFSSFRYRSSEVVEFSLPRVAKQMVLPGSILRTGWAPTNIPSLLLWFSEWVFNDLMGIYPLVNSHRPWKYAIFSGNQSSNPYLPGSMLIYRRVMGI